MKRRLLASAALLACLTASAQDKELYIRGAFNGWGTDNALAHKGKGVYEADILVSPGNHAFKVGSRDWRDETSACRSACAEARVEARAGGRRAQS